MSPLAGETFPSLLGRVAARYGVDMAALLTAWQWQGQRPRHESGAARADAEVLLDAGGRLVLAELCGVPEGVLARAMPAWGLEDEKLALVRGSRAGSGGRGVWRVGGAVVGPVAFGCRLCTARRTGTRVGAVRYAQRWERVCVQHRRWLLDADANLGQGLEFLDLRGLPEVVAAQRRWRAVARRAARLGVGPGEVFGVAWAVVCRWWDQALEWEQEQVWPARLHAVAGGDAGGDFWRWRVVGRDAVIFPEVVEVAAVLLDPRMVELVWLDSGGEQPRVQTVNSVFCRRLGERVGRGWLGPLVAADWGGPLMAWKGVVVRGRRYAPAGLPGRREDAWWVRQELQPRTMAAQLRVLGREARLPARGRCGARRWSRSGGC
ncbi:hypothetical protein GCM10010441_61900 [Kitasatospora paracochleata]|uniref:DNA-binding protein n=1 Tax=Kitasatospora paracochleata TaxID=58354 RepID=UPI0031DF1763